MRCYSSRGPGQPKGEASGSRFRPQKMKVPLPPIEALFQDFSSSKKNYSSRAVLGPLLTTNYQKKLFRVARMGGGLYIIHLQCAECS